MNNKSLTIKRNPKEFPVEPFQTENVIHEVWLEIYSDRARRLICCFEKSAWTIPRRGFKHFKAVLQSSFFQSLLITLLLWWMPETVILKALSCTADLQHSRLRALIAAPNAGPLYFYSLSLLSIKTFKPRQHQIMRLDCVYYLLWE